MWWIIMAFLRGKILHQRNYRPREEHFFHAVPGATIQRMTILMRWWGFRPATMEELSAFWEGMTSDAKRTPLVALDPIAVAEYGRQQVQVVQRRYPDARWNYDVAYLDEGSEAKFPSFGRLDKSRDWGRRTRFLAVRAIRM